MTDSEQSLRAFVNAIAEGRSAAALQMLAASPDLARASFRTGATRQAANEYFLNPVGRYVVVGDTALHIAAAAYQADTLRELLRAGADVRARNRFGDEPLHAAAVGNPVSYRWNPAAQTATIGKPHMRRSSCPRWGAARRNVTRAAGMRSCSRASRASARASASVGRFRSTARGHSRA